MSSMNLASPAARLLALPRVALAGIVLVVIGAFGAWVSASVGGTGVTAKTGLDGDGSITLLLALVSGGLLAAAHARTSHRLRVASLVPAALLVLVAAVDVLDVLNTDAGIVDVSVGWGLWATLVGGALLAGDIARRLRG